MAELHLLALLAGDVGHVIAAFLLGNFGIEHDVQQHVAEFLAKVGVTVLQHGVAQFVHFLERQRAQRIDGLGAVPRAFRPQPVHNVEQPPDLTQFFFLGMHRSIIKARNDKPPYK